MAQEGGQDGRLPRTTTQAFLFPYPLIFSSSQDQGGRDQFHGQQTVVDQPLGLFLESGSSDAVFSTADGKIIVGQSSHSQHCREDVRGSVVRSEMNASERSSPDQQLRLMDMDGCNSSSSRGGGAVIKMCSSCSATKTPLWRSGPKGPKSLCNACGIRQRKKARRATEAAAAAAAGSGLVAARKVRKEKKIDGNCILPYKKRYKIINAAPTG